MNKVFLTGNLCAEPEIRVTPDGVPVCQFRLAVPHNYKDPKTGKRGADFFTVSAWRKLGEMCGQYLTKGQKCAVIAKLKPQTYEKDGTKHYTIGIIAEEVEFLSAPKREESTSVIDETKTAE